MLQIRCVVLQVSHFIANEYSLLAIHTDTTIHRRIPPPASFLPQPPMNPYMCIRTENAWNSFDEYSSCRFYQSREVFTLMSIVDDMHIDSTSSTKKNVEQFSLIPISFVGSAWKCVSTSKIHHMHMCWWRFRHLERQTRQAKLSTDWEINKQTNEKRKKKKICRAPVSSKS